MPPSTSDHEAARAGDDPGRKIFFAQGCHRVSAAGTPIAAMLRLALTDEEILALARYLASLR